MPEPFVFRAVASVPELGIHARDNLVVAPWRPDWLAIRRYGVPRPDLVLQLAMRGRLELLAGDLEEFQAAAGVSLRGPHRRHLELCR